MRDLARRAGELHPEWVMVGVDVPAGKRLYASRDLKDSAFAVAMSEFGGSADGWHLTSTLQRMLIITKATYAECLAELMMIWQNWDNAGRELPAAGDAGPVARPALPPARREKQPSRRPLGAGGRPGTIE